MEKEKFSTNTRLKYLLGEGLPDNGLDDTTQDILVKELQTNYSIFIDDLSDLYREGKIPLDSAAGRDVWRILLSELKDRGDAKHYDNVLRHLSERYMNRFLEVAEFLFYVASSGIGYPYILFAHDQWETADEGRSRLADKLFRRKALREVRNALRV